jgi:hypothetical protein
MGNAADRLVKRVKLEAAARTRVDVKLGSEIIECVHTFCYLGSMLSADGSDTPDVERRIALARVSFNSLSCI